MNDFSAIDGFLDTFVRYIDSGFGLITGDVTSLAAILIVIDVTLAALFWAWGSSDILLSLVRKTLTVGAFAFIFGNFARLSGLVFDSFVRLGLKAGAATFAPADLLKPGMVAAEGLIASKPVFDHVGGLAPGPVEFFANMPEIVLLTLGGIVVIASFFVLSIQLFVLIVEFKLVTLAGFILVPFAFWRQTTFLAERVLAHVMASGVKVLVIAVVIGIGSTMFGTLRTALDPQDMTIAQAFAVVLGALTLMGLAVFCPRIAVGLISGAPQLSAGAAAGTLVGVGAAGLGVTAAAATGLRAGGQAAAWAASSAATTAGGLGAAARLGARRTGLSSAAAAPLNAGVGLSAAAAGGVGQAASRLAGHFKDRVRAGASAVNAASGGAIRSGSPLRGGASATTDDARSTSAPSAGQPPQPPAWAQRFARAQALREGVMLTANTLGQGDAGGGSPGPDLKEKE